MIAACDVERHYTLPLIDHAMANKVKALNMNRSCLLAGILVLTSTALTMADGPHEPRQSATDVFSGKVVAVYRNKGRVLDACVVEIAVDMVEKGDAAKPGMTVYTFCRINPPGATVKPGQTGHSMAPEPGQSVRVFIKHANGKNEGVYPDWVDVLKETSSQATAERSDAADSR
mgnify:CR=1 FL=1